MISSETGEQIAMLLILLLGLGGLAIITGIAVLLWKTILNE